MKPPFAIKDLIKFPPAVVQEPGKLTGLMYVGNGNVYAAIADHHGDNFIISTAIRADGTFSLDIESTDWVEVEDLENLQ